MFKFFKGLAVFFGFLALASLGHDVYLMDAKGTPFAFAAFGWSLKNYAPEYETLVIDMFGVEAFNAFIGPFLAQKATLFLGVLGGICGAAALPFYLRNKMVEREETKGVFGKRRNRK